MNNELCAVSNGLRFCDIEINLKIFKFSNLFLYIAIAFLEPIEGPTLNFFKLLS